MRMAGEYDDDIMRIRDEDHRKREVHGAHSTHSAVHSAWIMLENHGMALAGKVAGLNLHPGSCPISRHFTVQLIGLEQLPRHQLLG